MNNGMKIENTPKPNHTPLRVCVLKQELNRNGIHVPRLIDTYIDALYRRRHRSLLALHYLLISLRQVICVRFFVFQEGSRVKTPCADYENPAQILRFLMRKYRSLAP